MAVTRALRRRLTPLYAAMFLQNVTLWVPVEKLFMTSIGFDAATIGVMAAVYAFVVPVLEIPSGILADRWSRRGVLLIATAALVVSVAVGGFSQNVAAYLVSAMFLGVFFAMQSGTPDAIVYDTVVEVTGNSDAFERVLGRLRMWQSIALIVGAIAGGAIGEVAPPRLTYFLTVPFIVASGLALLAIREPRLHRSEKPESLREQIATTYRAILRRGVLRPVVTLIVLTSLLTQALFEFGPLWLIALAVPTIVYGPHWAGLTGALGVGGVLGAWPVLTRPITLAVGGILLVGSCVVLALIKSAAVVIVAQVVVIVIVVAASIPAMRRLHDAVPSTIRSGVLSGVSTLTWLVFIPFSFAFGFVADSAGVFPASWLLVGIAVLAAVLIVPVLRNAPTETPVPEAAFQKDRFLPDDDPRFPGHWSEPPRAWHDMGVAGAVWDEHTLAEVRHAIVGLTTAQRQVIVLRDVNGRPAAEVREILKLDADTERALLNQARGRIRAHLEQYLARRPA